MIRLHSMRRNLKRQVNHHDVKLIDKMFPLHASNFLLKNIIEKQLQRE